MNPVDRLEQLLVMYTWIIVPTLVSIGIAAHIIRRRLHGPEKLERALLDRLKGMK